MMLRHPNLLRHSKLCKPVLKEGGATQLQHNENRISFIFVMF
jgi:hypothetical protein